eukprot:m.194168 g.194168  ORF g.194168 m.194168 type:complete len:50 (+) comp14888_c0_seq9:1488-1637(+)
MRPPPCYNHTQTPNSNYLKNRDWFWMDNATYFRLMTSHLKPSSKTPLTT